MRRKLCRAAGCHRRIDDAFLFCSMHHGMLRPRLREPIADNRELPQGEQPSLARKRLSAVDDAVTYLAKMEGKAEDLERARRSQSFVPSQGGQPARDVPSPTQLYGSGGSSKYDVKT